MKTELHAQCVRLQVWIPGLPPSQPLLLPLSPVLAHLDTDSGLVLFQEVWWHPPRQLSLPLGFLVSSSVWVGGLMVTPS